MNSSNIVTIQNFDDIINEINYAILDYASEDLDREKCEQDGTCCSGWGCEGPVIEERPPIIYDFDKLICEMLRRILRLNTLTDVQKYIIWRIIVLALRDTSTEEYLDYDRSGYYNEYDVISKLDGKLIYKLLEYNLDNFDIMNILLDIHGIDDTYNIPINMFALLGFEYSDKEPKNWQYINYLHDISISDIKYSAKTLQKRNPEVYASCDKIIIVCRLLNEHLHLVDGYHRLRSALERGLNTVDVVLIEEKVTMVKPVEF